MSDNILHGDAARAYVANSLGRELTQKESRIIGLEGFAPTPYEDTKGIMTTGVGQTGEWMDKSFPESLAYHEEETRRMVPKYDELSQDLQTELLQATYRGDLQQSPTARRLLNEGKYAEASAEFLDHDEFRNDKTPQQIKDRLTSVSRALAQEAGVEGTVNNGTYTAVAGDNPYTIAQRHGISLEELASLNPEVGVALQQGRLGLGQQLNVKYTGLE